MPSFDEAHLPLTFSHPSETSPARLDAALGFALPDLGLRARRRLWEWCAVLVNNRPQQAGFLVYPGDTITLCSRSGRWHGQGLSPATPSPEVPSANLPALVGDGAGFAFINKPWGIHSAHIAGTTTASVEALLPRLWATYLHARENDNAPPVDEPQQTASQASPAVSETHAFSFSCHGATLHPAQPESLSPATPHLLTRLDGDTSGLLIATNSPDADARFRQWEATGQTRKTYFALVAGACTQPLYIDTALNITNRATTTVLDAAEPDTTRHTCVTPVAHWQNTEALECSLVQVEIRRGARHQIRAHLASAGFPLVGDARYGSCVSLDTVFRLLMQTLHMPLAPTAALPGYLLHHACTTTPEFTASLAPAWLGLEELCTNKDSPPSPHGR